MADGLNIDKLKLSVDVDAKNSIKNINKLNSSLNKLSKTINNLGIENLSGLNGIGGGSGSGGGKSKGSSLRDTLFDVANLSRVVRMFKQITNAVKSVYRATANLVKVGMEYTETLNLWQVAMGQNIDQAEEFVKSMQKAYGLASTTVMQYQATFRNMLNSLGGLNTDTSYKLSEYLMQMALDYSSLYNTTIEKAMNDFQSALSGQVRPIRSVSGYDITDNTIYDLYQSIGGTKTEAQLSQTEKRLLRIMAIFKQMGRSGAIGDLNKTLENTANQIRIIEEKTTELKSWLGIIVEQLVKPLLPLISAFVTVLTEVAQIIARDLGYEEFDGTIGAFEEINDQADELSGKLLSFDKFEALNLTSDQDSSAGIDQVVLDAMSEYESMWGDVATTADKLAKSVRNMFIDGNGNLKGWVKLIEDILKGIMNWVSSLYKFNEETGEYELQLDGIITKLKSIPAIIGLIIATKNKGKITDFITGLIPSTSTGTLKDVVSKMGLSDISKIISTETKGATNNLNELSKNLEALGATKNAEAIDNVASSISGIGKATKGIGVGGWVGIVLAIVAALIYLYNTNDEVHASLDQLFEALKPLLSIVSEIVNLLMDSLGTALQGLAPIISIIIDCVTALVYVLEVVLICCYAVLEALTKIWKSEQLIFNPTKWKNLGSELKDIWSNWTTADLFNQLDASASGFEFKVGSTTTSTPKTSSYSTSSVASTSGITNKSTTNTTSASSAMTSSTYSALQANSSQSGGSSTEVKVYLDGKSVGTGTAKYVYNELIRAGIMRQS